MLQVWLLRLTGCRCSEGTLRSLALAGARAVRQHGVGSPCMACSAQHASQGQAPAWELLLAPPCSHGVPHLMAYFVYTQPPSSALGAPDCKSCSQGMGMAAVLYRATTRISCTASDLQGSRQEASKTHTKPHLITSSAVGEARLPLAPCGFLSASRSSLRALSCL